MMEICLFVLILKAVCWVIRIVKPDFEKQVRSAESIYVNAKNQRIRNSSKTAKSQRLTVQYASRKNVQARPAPYAEPFKKAPVLTAVDRYNDGFCTDSGYIYKKAG